ncbi:MAG: TetR/AcrR family transcriptional regulator [Candidatus Nanopelagicales bacterium]
MTADPEAVPLQAPAPRKRNPRGSLNPEVILAEAFRLCREETLDELSMPKLARRLGVGVTSLYWYFHTKEELLQVMLEQVAHEFLHALPDYDSLPWDEHFRRYFTQMRRIFLANEVICDFLVMRTHMSIMNPGQFFIERLNREVGVLLDAGFAPDIATRGYQAMSVYTTGSVQKIRQLQIRGENTEGKMFPIDDMETMQSIADKYPNLQLTAPYWHRTYSTNIDYEVGLNLIIDGLRTHLK